MVNIRISLSKFVQFGLRPLGYALCLVLVLAGHVPLSAQTAPVSDSEEPLSTIERIRNRDNVMIAGVKQDFKPFGFIDENSKHVGFDLDLMQAMADLWGVELELLPVTSANRIDKLIAGEVDIVAASMTHTRPRDADIDFSQTYFLDGQSLLVGVNSGIENIEGLAGKSVAAVEGTTGIEQIRQYAEQTQVDLTVAPFPGYNEALSAMRAGDIDALTTDRAFLLQTAQDNPEFTVVGERFTQEPYGIGVRSGDAHFRMLVDFTLQQLQRDGTYEEIYNRWFPGEIAYQPEMIPGQPPFTFETSPGAFDSPTSTRMVDIVQDRRLVVGVRYDFPPFGFVDERGKVSGFDADIAREFARRWLGDPEAVDMVRVTSGSRIPALVNGEVDLLLAAMGRQQEQSDAIDFSQTYFVDGQRLLTQRGSGINDVGDLAGRTVAAVTDSTAMETMRALSDAEGLAVDILPFQEYVAAVRAVEAGYVDALIDDGAALARSAAMNPDLEVVGELLSEERYGIGIPNYDASFRDLVNFTLQEMKLDGAYDAIHATWFAEQEPYTIELWPGSSPRSSSIRLSNLAAESAITPQPVTSPATPTATPTATPSATASAAVTQQTPITPAIGAQAATATLTPTTSISATAISTSTIAPMGTDPTTIDATEITPTVAPVAEAAPEVTAQVTPQSGLYITIPEEYGVFARVTTSTNSDSLTLLSNGRIYETVARTDSNSWVQVLLDDGRTAWVYRGVVKIQPEQLAALPVVVVDDNGEVVPVPTATPIPPTPTAQPAGDEPGSVRHIVLPGEYLSTLAERYYNNQLFWPIIYEANRDIVGSDPGRIETGIELVIPPITE